MKLTLEHIPSVDLYRVTRSDTVRYPPGRTMIPDQLRDLERSGCRLTLVAKSHRPEKKLSRSDQWQELLQRRKVR